jgi:hypothetical protein
MTPKANSSIASVAAVAGIIAAVALFRVLRATLVPELPNFSPVMAMAFCGGLLLPGLLAWFLPLAVIVLSDLALSVSLGYPILGSGQLIGWACLWMAVALGRWVSTWQELKITPLAAVITANALIFYVVTNAVAWVVEPSYARSSFGFVQALTTGLPGYPPTWQFFRNALISDFIFAGLIFAVLHLALRRSGSPMVSEPGRLPS